MKGQNRDGSRSLQSRSHLRQCCTVVQVSIKREEARLESYASEALLSVIMTLPCHSQGKIGSLDIVCRVGNVEDTITSLYVDRDGNVLADSSVCGRNESSKSCGCECFGHDGKRLQHDRELQVNGVRSEKDRVLSHRKRNIYSVRKESSSHD